MWVFCVATGGALMCHRGLKVGLERKSLLCEHLRNDCWASVTVHKVPVLTLTKTFSPAEPEAEFRPCLSCPVAFSSPHFLTRYVLCGHPPQVFPSSSAGSHLPLQAPRCSSGKAEDGETEGSGTMFGSLQLSGTSRAFFSPSQGQPVDWVDGNRGGVIGHDPTQGMSSQEADATFTGTDISGSIFTGYSPIS